MKIVGGKSRSFAAYGLAEHVCKVVLCRKGTQEILVEAHKLEPQIAGEDGAVTEGPHAAEGVEGPDHEKRQ